MICDAFEVISKTKIDYYGFLNVNIVKYNQNFYRIDPGPLYIKLIILQLHIFAK